MLADACLLTTISRAVFMKVERKLAQPVHLAENVQTVLGFVCWREGVLARGHATDRCRSVC